MFLGLVLASLCFQGPVRTVELSRGAVVSGAPNYTYWDCEDTTLDGTDPDANRGGEATLIGGPSCAILIRFGDLSRALGHSRHVRRASIVLSVASGDKPVLAGAARLLQPWGEGPYQTIKTTLSLLTQTAPGEKTTKPAPPKMAATWRARQAGFDNGNWQQPGAKGSLDSTPIPNATVAASDKDVEIKGLAEAFQWMADHPSRNDGIALYFSSPVEFFSAQAPTGRPRLVLELEDGPPITGPDLSVVCIERSAQNGFKAHIKNVGDAPSAGFAAAWSMNGRTGSTIDHSETLAPGQETVLTTTEMPRVDPSDPRSGTVSMDITPTGPDADSANNGLTIFAQGRALDFIVSPEVAELAKKAQGGTHCIEDWLQAQVRIFNETYLAQSHFAFEPDGAKERISIQSIHLDPNEGAPLHGDSKVIVTPELFASAEVIPTDHQPRTNNHLLRAIGTAIGLIDYAPMNVAARSGAVTIPGAADRGSEDLCPGLMGGGDTRFDGAASGVLMVPNEPSYSPEDSSTPDEPTGLLSMTDVFMLDSSIGKPIPKGLPSVFPKAILLEARDLLRRPLGGISLSFFQSSGSKILDGPPTFQIKMGDSGDSVIPNRESQSIFGKLEPNGSNGLLLVKAEANGVSEWGWIKAWQLIDAYARGITSAGILGITFDLPGSPLESDRDLALQKIVSDSTGQPSDKLALVVDGDGKHAVSLGEKAGDWIEVDLGRDRTLAEIKISARPDAFWQSFDILLYGTGQRTQDALVFARERNWAYSRRCRSDGPEDTATVSYRGLPLQIRYIRILSRSGGRAEINKISVTAAKLSN